MEIREKVNEIKREYPKWFYSCKALIQKIPLSIEDPKDKFVEFGEQIIEKVERDLTKIVYEFDLAFNISSKLRFQLIC